MADKPTQKRVVALRYDPASDGAPKIVAKGKGRTAEQILETRTSFRCSVV